MISDAIDQVLQLNQLATILRLLSETSDARLQYEILWILTNICAGDHRQTAHVVQAGAIPILLERAASSQSPLDVTIQTWWCLGNVAGDGPQFRSMLVEQGLIPTLQTFCHRVSWDRGSLDAQQAQVTRILSWLIANLCRGSRSQELWSQVYYVISFHVYLFLERPANGTNTIRCSLLCPIAWVPLDGAAPGYSARVYPYAGL